MIGPIGLAVLLATGSCAEVERPDEPMKPVEWKPANTLEVGHEDAFGFIHRVEIDAQGKSSAHRVRKIPSKHIGFEAPVEKKAEPESKISTPRKPPTKLHPLLTEWIAARNPDDEVEVLVRFADTFKIPRLPALPAGVDRDSPEAKRYVEARRKAIDEIRKIREFRQHGTLKKMEGHKQKERPKFEVMASFWLTNIAIVKMPLGAVRALAEQAEVLYVQPRPVRSHRRTPTLTTMRSTEGRESSPIPTSTLG